MRVWEGTAAFTEQWASREWWEIRLGRWVGNIKCLGHRGQGGWGSRGQEDREVLSAPETEVMWGLMREERVQPLAGKEV